MAWFKKKPRSPSELIDEGLALLERFQYAKALDKMRAASELDPSSATPHAWMADVLARTFYVAVTAGDAHAADALHADARATARAALDLDPREERALSVLGRLARIRQGLLLSEPPSVSEAMLPAGKLLREGRLDEARVAYVEVARAHPGLAEPIKRAGNCAYAARNPRLAEMFFREACACEPLDPQAHHFLSDALRMQGRVEPARAAIIDAIAANPAYAPAWSVLGGIDRDRGLVRRSLRIQPPLSILAAEDGKPHVRLDADLLSGNAEGAVWTVYGMTKIDDPDHPDSPSHGLAQTPLAVELRSYRAALEIYRVQCDSLARQRFTPGIAVLRELAEIDGRGEGDLMMTLLLLDFAEPYRDEFEAVKRAQPDACARFLDRYDLTPL